MRHHPSTPLGRLADAIHRAYVRLFGDRGTAPGAHHRNPGRPAMLLASTAVRREQAHRALRAECERMATLLDGVRRGRSESVFFRAKLRREAATAMGRMKAAARVPARTRFAHAGVAVRTAARETAAVAARAARQAGAPAHRHIAGVTDAYHDMAAQILARARAYGATRAKGENSIWTTPRGLPA